MDRLRERLRQAVRALVALEELAGLESPGKIEGGCGDQRFEYTFEACSKTARRYLYAVEGIHSGSPEEVIRRSRTVGLLSDEETVQGLELADDRNLTAHRPKLSFWLLSQSRGDMRYSPVPLAGSRRDHTWWTLWWTDQTVRS